MDRVLQTEKLTDGWNQRVERYAQANFSLLDRLGAVSIYRAKTFP